MNASNDRLIPRFDIKYVQKVKTALICAWLVYSLSHFIFSFSVLHVLRHILINLQAFFLIQAACQTSATFARGDFKSCGYLSFFLTIWAYTWYGFHSSVVLCCSSQNKKRTQEASNPIDKMYTVKGPIKIKKNETQIK